MITTWAYALGSVSLVSLASLAGVFTISLNEARLRRIIFLLVALSAGALFGDALIHLLPEIFTGTLNPRLASLLVLAGIVSFLILEKFLLWGHTHELEECHEPHHHEIKPIGRVNLISDGLHNFIDGIAIGASFLVSSELGLATTIAIMLHEIPQEIGDFGILLHAGYSRRRALWLNLLSALVAILGTLVVLILGEQLTQLTDWLLPIAAGGFLYIAGSDLVPELHKTTDKARSLVQVAAFLIGILLMYLLLFLE